MRPSLGLLFAHAAHAHTTAPLWLLLALAATHALAASPAPSYFVAPSGSDAAPGTLAQPFRTPARGAAALRAACDPLCAAGATLTLRGGEYPVSAPIALAGVRSGDAAAPITVRAYAGEAARVVGTAPVRLARPAAGDPALALFGPAAAARALAGALPPGAAPGGGGELYVGDAPQVLARWPDAPVARAFALRDARVVARAAAACAAPRDEPFFCAGWARTRAEDGWSWGSVRASAAAPFYNWSLRAPWMLRGLFTYDWAGAESTVASVAPAGGDGSVNFTRATWTSGGYWGGARYFAEGAPEAMDDAGEYWVEWDASPPRVWWLPPDDVAPPAAVDGAWALTPTLLSVSAAQHVVVRGLTFVGATGAALTVANASDVLVTQCAFLGAGLRAVDAHDAGNARVTLAANFVAGTGADGLWITGGNATRLEPSGAAVVDNVIVNFGRLGFAFNPAVGIDGVGTLLSHNIAVSGPACGLMFSGAGQVIEFNIVADALRATFDMGVVCTGPRDWTQSGVAVRGNALLRNGFTPILGNHVTDPLRVGFYFDYGNAAHTIEGNVVWQDTHPATPAVADVPRAAATRAFASYNHGGRHARVAGNVFVGIAGALSNGGSLEGGDPAALTNGSHYFASLAFCREALGAACDALPGVAALASAAPPGGAAACAAAAASCGAAPFNCSAVANALALLPPNASAAAGNAEGVPYLIANNTASGGTDFFAAAAAFASTLNFSLAAGAAPLAAGTPQPPMDEWGPRWLQPGAWRSILWAAVPWAVGDAPAGAPRLDLKAAAWWLDVARDGSAGPLASREPDAPSL